MLQTVEGIIDADGTVFLLEPLPVTKPSRIFVTLLDDKFGVPTSEEVDAVKFLSENRTPDNTPPYPEEIETKMIEPR